MSLRQARLLLVLGALAALPACAPNHSPEGHAAGSIGRVDRSVRAIVVGAMSDAVDGAPTDGTLTEEAATRQDGMRYVVKTDGGTLLTVFQGKHPAFRIGQRVLVLEGKPLRIIADPG